MKNLRFVQSLISSVITRPPPSPSPIIMHKHFRDPPLPPPRVEPESKKSNVNDILNRLSIVRNVRRSF